MVLDIPISRKVIRLRQPTWFSRLFQGLPSGPPHASSQTTHCLLAIYFRHLRCIRDFHPLARCAAKRTKTRPASQPDVGQTGSTPPFYFLGIRLRIMSIGFTGWSVLKRTICSGCRAASSGLPSSSKSSPTFCLNKVPPGPKNSTSCPGLK